MRSPAPLPTRFGAVVGLAVITVAGVFATAFALEQDVPMAAVVVGWTALLASSVLETVVTTRVIEWRAGTSDPAAAIDTVRADVAELSDALGIRQPEVVLLERADPTAMIASVPGVSRLYMSTALLEAATPAERRALLAHELAHASHRDGLVAVVGSTVSNAIGLVVFWWWALSGSSVQIQILGIGAFQALYLSRSVRPARLLVTVLSGLTSLLVSLALVQVSRYQEYRADATAASLVGDPRRVVRGLATLDVRQRRFEPASRLHWERAGSESEVGDRLWSHHPSHDRRVDRLLATGDSE